MQSGRRCVAAQVPSVSRPFRFFSFLEALLLQLMDFSAHPAILHDLAAVLERSVAQWRNFDRFLSSRWKGSVAVSRPFDSLLAASSFRRELQQTV
jgi:hypothetical protein